MKKALSLLFLLISIFSFGQNGKAYFGKIGINVGTTEPSERFRVNGAGHFTGTLTANSIVKIGGTNSQFLMAGGGINSAVYAPANNAVFTGNTEFAGNTRLRGLVEFPTNSDILFNAYFSGDFKYRNNGYAADIYQNGVGDIIFQTAPSGTSNAAATLTTRMAISNVGNVDILSTTGALIVPRMTAAQRTALTGSNGMIVYQTDGTAGFYFYESGAWVKK